MTMITRVLLLFTLATFALIAAWPQGVAQIPEAGPRLISLREAALVWAGQVSDALAASETLAAILASPAAKAILSHREVAGVLTAALILAAFVVMILRPRGKKAEPPKLPALRPDPVELEFLPAALELFETPPSPVRITAIWFICVAFATALLWAYFGWLEIYSVAQGRIQPSGRSKIIQSLDPGKVIRIGVENGAKVQAGDLLLELDPKETAADRDEQARELESALAEAVRRKVAVKAAHDNTPAPRAPAYPDGTSEEVRLREDAVLAADLAQLFSAKASLLAQIKEHEATRDRYRASIAAREKLIAVDKEHVDMRETLNLTRSASRAQVIETLQQYEAQVTTQTGEKGQLVETEASLVTLERKLEETVAQFIADQTQKQAEALRKADHAKSELIKAASKHERTRLLAPVAGTVQQLAVTTQGQVVTTGQSLMTIVPFEAPIEIEALIENQDIGFVEPGQAATVKIESFPFTRFGTIDGTVLKVSRDAVDQTEAMALNDPKRSAKPKDPALSSEPSKAQTLVFPATLALSRKTITVEGKEIPLQPGMAVTVEVRTGQRRAIDYVLSPLREVVTTSAHER